ncbi:MAG: hypothetical protein J6Z49_04890 [Kiritimatiellae bacterium]|nr:hypothetical protein [Kiritimatiellia bacterium]
MCLIALVMVGFVAFGAWAGCPSDAKIPIVGWSGLPLQMASAERYREAKDAGFTHLTQWCKSPSEAKRLLAEAEKAGVKLIIGFVAHGVNGIKRMTDEAEAFVSAVKDSPALEYYYVTDEPHISAAERIRDCVARYEALDPAHPCYVNLFGSSYDPGTRRDAERMRRNSGCNTYGEYLNRLFAIVPLKMLSFDVYPILSLKPIENADLRLHGTRVFLGERWYETLEIASAFARERKIPLCTFALATAHRHYPANNYPVPTREHLRLQMYSNLAYGAQMLQYFRYHMGSPDRAPIASGGKRSPLFELVREMNQEIQARAYVFLGAKVQGVWHTGLDIPLGTRRFDAKVLPPFAKSFSAPKGTTAVVSLLRNGEREYFMVVNRDPNDDMSFTATFAPGTELVRRDGSLVPADAYADTFWLDPGDTAIFCWTGLDARQTHRGAEDRLK